MDENQTITGSNPFVFDYMMEGCQIIGHDWKYIYLNDAADVHNRRPKEELLGKRFTDMWPGVEKTKVYKSIKECLEVRKNLQIETEFIFPDGAKAWFDLRIQPIPEGVFILSIDITDRKKTIEKLGESEKLFRNLFKNMLNGFAYCKMICEEGHKLDFLYIDVNEAFGKLTGLEGVTGKRASEVIPGIQEADPELLERYNRVSSTGIPEVFETYVDSLRMWFAISVYSPQREYFVALFDVITARKLAEESLHESRATLQSIIDYSNSLIYIVDGEGRFLLVNKPLQKLLAPSGEQMVGQTRDSFLPKKIAGLHRKNDMEVFRTGRTQIFEEENLEPDGNHYYLTTKFPLFNTQNEIYAIGGLSTDISDRKKIENTLIENEERFRSLYENVTIGIYRTTAEGKILMANPALIKMLGFDSFAQLADRNLENEGYEPDYPRSKFIDTIEKQGKIVGLESAWKRRNGDILFIRESAKAVMDNKGRLLYYDGTVEDITDRKKTEEALRESEDKFKYVFDHSVIGKSITFPSGELHVNKSFCDMIGYSHKELEKTKWQDITHLDDIKLTEKEMQSLISGEKETTRFNKRYLHKNGSIIWANVGTQLRRDSAGRPLYFMTSVIDITERKKAEEALRESEERFSKSFRTSPISFMIANLEDGRIIEVNDAFTKISGFTREEALGNTTLNMKMWVNEDDRKHMIESLIGGRPILHKEAMLRGKKGNVAVVLMSAHVIKLANKNCIISSIEDITERKNAELQIKRLNEQLEYRVVQRTELLEAANKELESFSYSVSHDLRAPLRAVNGYTKILVEEFGNLLGDEGKRICGIISGSAMQMGELIDDLLSFSRIGRSEFSPAMIDMKKMTGIIFEGITNPVERIRIKLKIGNLHTALGDIKLIGQVWTNLISNAIKYSSKNEVSEIVIGSRVSDNMVIYFVKDNGVGFDMQYAPKLFGVFQRLHSESEFEGNGVGLAIVQRIVLKHGGKVWAEGEVGKGATFYFSLPFN